MAEAGTSNDPRASSRSPFPQDAIACIHKPCRSATASGKARTKSWRLTFARCSAPFIEPLMGWTDGDDTLTQIELDFRTLDSAIRYAERQGLSYTTDDAEIGARRVARPAHAFSKATL